MAKPKSKTPPPHRHDRSMWIICGGLYAWCYACGAIRAMKRTAPNEGTWAEPRWTVPTGDPKDNPA